METSGVVVVKGGGGEGRGSLVLGSSPRNILGSLPGLGGPGLLHVSFLPSPELLT